MGDADKSTKILMQRNDRFADIFNFFLYKGKQVIRPEDLQSADTTSTVALKESNTNKSGYFERYRDLLKRAVIKHDNKFTYLLLGIENQTEIHYAMPVRNMFYDAAQYISQINSMPKKDFKTSAEFLSNFGKEDKLLPVITLVVLYNPKKWDAPITLYDMFDKNDPVYADLKEFINDYKINLVAPYGISEEDLTKFKTDLGSTFTIIKHSDSKDDMLEITQSDDFYQHVPRDVYNVFKYCINLDLGVNENEEEIDMCKALQDIYAEAEEIKTKALAEAKAKVTEAEAKAKAEAEAKIKAEVEKAKAEIEAEAKAEAEKKDLSRIKNLMERLNLSFKDAFYLLDLPALSYDIYLINFEEEFPHLINISNNSIDPINSNINILDNLSNTDSSDNGSDNNHTSEFIK